MFSFNLKYPLKILPPNAVTLEVRASTHGLAVVGNAVQYTIPGCVFPGILSTHIRKNPVAYSVPVETGFPQLQSSGDPSCEYKLPQTHVVPDKTLSLLCQLYGY